MLTAASELLVTAARTKFQTILADPPWQFQNRTGKMAPEHKRLSRYSTMKLPEIAALPVSGIVGSVLSWVQGRKSLVLVLIIGICSLCFQKSASAITLQSQGPEERSFSDPAVHIGVLDITKTIEIYPLPQECGKLLCRQGPSTWQTAERYCEPASYLSTDRNGGINVGYDAKEGPAIETWSWRKARDIVRDSGCYLPVDIHRSGISMVHDDEINEDLFPCDYWPVKPQMLYSDSWSMRRVKFFARQLNLIADKSRLPVRYISEGNSEPSDDNRGNGANCPGIGIEPSENVVKPTHYKSDWFMALAVILSPFIAGFFACKMDRDLDTYINRNTKTIDKH